MEIVKKHSILISLILYFGISLLMAEVIYLSISQLIDLALINLLKPRPDSIVLQGKRLISIFTGENAYEGMPIVTNQSMFQILKMIKTVIPIIIFGFSIFIAALIFYRVKLKKQLDLLQYGVDKILKQDLDFNLECINKNEVGQLCNSFELMRSNLKNTFQKLWDAEEKQNILMRAFSHDLRTPLTILKGNNDVIRYLLDRENQEKNIRQSLSMSDEAIKRIELYSEALRNYKDLEQWEMKKVSVDLFEFKANLIRQCQIWESEYHKKIEVKCEGHNVCDFDPVLTQLVMDKIIENALRFAESKVIIKICLEKNGLEFMVEDDGKGFCPKSVKYATDIFYSTDKARGHSGLGLTIADRLLGICDSCLKIDNKESSGACVSFFIKL